MVADLLSCIAATTTLPELLRTAAETTPDQVIIHIAAAGNERSISYHELYRSSQAVGQTLRRSGLSTGQVVLIALESSVDFLVGFWGALFAGLVPAPLAAEPKRILAIWQSLEQPALLVNHAVGESIIALAEQLAPPAQLAQERPTALDGPWTTAVQLFSPITKRHRSGHISAEGSVQPHDLAYLQFSSGSTGQPRGVELSHAGLLANLYQMGSACAINSQDSVVSWMPYYHDMGLIAAHLLPLAAGIKQVKIDEFYFARRPAIWLEITHQHQASLLTAAPFALDLVNRRVKPAQLVGLDLRCVRLLIVGAEPIVAASCRAFLAQLAPTGLSPQVLLPVYGLAEACVGVSLSPLGTGMTTHHINRHILLHEARASSPDENQHHSTDPIDQTDWLELVDVGLPIPDCRVRIVDDQDKLLGDDLIGHIQVSGSQLMRGYYRSNDPSAAFCDGWLRTGDLGFLRNGRLVITGRAKEIVIVNGQKHHAPDLEDLISTVDGLHAKRIAVCGAERDGQRVVVFLAINAWQTVLPAINTAIRRLRRTTGTTIIDIVPLRASQFPRTSSGKLKRNVLRERYELGEFDAVIADVQQALAALNSPPRMALNHLEQAIIMLCAQTLELDPSQIGLHDSVFELGATSLQLMDLLAEIGDRFNREPDAAVLRNHPTPAGLIAWIQQPEIMSTNSMPDARSDRFATPEPIAIIGMACRLPDANTPEQFWLNLAAGVDSIKQLPSPRHDTTASPAPNGQAWGSQLATVSYFDHDFFNINADEAAAMDPQQRMLLELAYHALERAGYAAERRNGRRVGVFVGVGEASYQELLLPLLAHSEQLHSSIATGNMRNLIAGRIAHCLDLNGPAIAIDTACSSSLVALHMARTSLLVGDCDLALVGGINLNLTETPYQLLERAGALSPSGRCQAFDAAADGIVLGEGAGVLVLERLGHAQHNGDSILALIRGSAINNDGHSLSPMAPNPLRQTEVLRQAYREANLDPASISYIEAHGTGTAIGDPIEARSLAQAFPATSNQPRRIGSVKTNLGHLLNAAGIASLIKVILMFQQRQIPPSLHYTTPNQRFDLAAAGMTINTTLEPWHGPQPLRAGVNSFGFGGTNAHVILEAPAPAPNPAHIPNDFQMLPISARTEQALAELAATLAQRMQTDKALKLADVCFSLAEREVFSHRAVLASDGAERAHSELVDGLACLAAGAANPVLITAPPTAQRRKIALLFAGQGAQYPQQGALLYQQEAVFRATLDAASAQLGPINGRPLLEWCLDADVDSRALADTAVTQPLLVAFEVALARLVISWGLSPDALVGHSVGELAAACIAGVLSFEAVLELARARGQLMATLAEPGMMAAVFAPELIVATVVAHYAADVTIAAYNTPNQVVISGQRVAVMQALADLERDGFNAVIVNDHMAYHSPLIQAAVPAIAEVAAKFQPATPTLPLLSTVSVEWMHGTAKLDAEYWATQVVEPVRFAAALERLFNEGFDTLIEIGPGSTLTAFARQMAVGRAASSSVEALLKRGTNDYTTIRTAIGRLWVHGVDFKLSALVGKQGQRVPLPNYPFARIRHWLPTPPELKPRLQTLELKPTPEHPALLHGQAIAAVSLQTTPRGYRLNLKTADGQTLLELTNLREVAAPQPPPDHAPALLQQVVWTQTALAAPSDQALEQWVVIADNNNPLADQLLRLLNTANRACVVTTSAMLNSVLPTISNRYGLIILGALSSDEVIAQTNAFEQTCYVGALQLLDSIKSILALPTSKQPNGLWVVTAGAYAINNHTQVVAPQALLAGLAAALPDQRIKFPCVALDLELTDDIPAQGQLLLGELQTQPSNGVVAWRAGKRLTRTLAPLAGGPSKRPPSEKPGRVIIIAGGTGGVGAQLARHLATHNQPTLILLGRSALDAQRSSLLEQLNDLGAVARYCQVDICDPQQVDQLIAELAASSNGIFGIIQAAGIVDVGSLQAKSAQQLLAVLAPKVSGTWLLARALERYQQRPAFFINCSSIAAVVAGLGGGIADYVAANAFLDAFAASERQAGRPMTTLNWAAWDGIGLAANPMLVEQLRQRGLPPLHPSQALQAFDQVLYTEQRQVVILAPVESTAEPQYQATKAAITPPVAISNPAMNVTQQIQALVGNALKLPPEQISEDASFLALGLDSLQAVDLVKQLEQTLGTTLPLTLFFEFQTIRELVAYLSKQRQVGIAETVATDIVMQTIPSINLNQAFPIAPAQVSFYVGHQLYPASPAFTLIRQQIAGFLDQVALQQALCYLVERHPMLRAQFEPVDHEQPEPRQRIIAADLLPPSLWFEQREAPADHAVFEQQLAHYQFDLFKAPLFRVVLWPDSADRWVLLLLLHHSIADGWSTSILIDELWQVYTQLVQKQPIALPALACTFEHYTEHALKAATSQQASIDRAWWNSYLGQNNAAITWTLPTDAPLSEAITQPIGSFHQQLDLATSRELRQHAAALGVSLFHLLLAIYVRQLADWSHTNALAINVAEHGRSMRLVGIEQIVGCCADHLPLLLTLDEAADINSLAGLIRDQWTSIQQHSNISALDLARLSGVRHQTGPRAPGAASFSLARFPGKLPEDCPISIQALTASTATAATQLSLLIAEVRGVLQCTWIYATSAFQAHTIEQLANSYRRDLMAIIQPSQPQPALQSKLVAAKPQSLTPSRILDQCLRQPGRVAVNADGQLLTYAQLASYAAQVAIWLLANGAGPNQPVALLTQPGIASIVGMVGALWAGVPWLGLNPDYPLAQLHDQLTQAGVQRLLHHNQTHQTALQLQQSAMPQLQLGWLDQLIQQVTALTSMPSIATPTPTDLAYVIFTSGSTGRPKGVPITHGALANYLEWLVERFDYSPNDRLLQTAALSFDAAISQILGPLTSGGSVITLNALAVRDPLELLEVLERERPTIWRSVPALWERVITAIERRIADGQAAPALSELRLIGVGGEALPASYVRRWMDIYGEQQQIVNHYGPTEATINATAYQIRQRPSINAHIPIGKAITGTITRVLDQQGQICPLATIGELYIGGSGLAAGYLGRPDLTALQFVPDPLQAGARLYRTGDLVRELADGNLVFVGRVDEQIKLRGYRIEPAEIEAALQEHEAITKAVACMVEAGDQSILAAYLETKAVLPSDPELRRWLAKRLPPQMIPQRFYAVASFPITSSGKIDRARLRSLPIPAPINVAQGVQPETATELLLAEIWQKVLNLPHVYRDDDFFELGGDSLLLLQVLTRLEGRVAVLPRAASLYAQSSLVGFAQALDAAASQQQSTEQPTFAEQRSSIQADNPTFALTPAQIGFMLTEAFDPAAATTWCARLAITGPLDQALLQQALGILVKRHQMLRVRILTDQRPPLQQEQPFELPHLIVHDVQALLAAGADEHQLIEQHWYAEQTQRFQLDQPPLLRMRVLRLAPTRHIWLIAAHHIIGDGWSAWIFGQELLHIYDSLGRGESPRLPNLRSTFQDYVKLIQQSSEQSALHAAYWRNQFRQTYHRPLLPANNVEPAATTLNISRSLPAKTLKQLRQVAAVEGLTPYVVLLSLFIYQLRQLTAANDLVIGTAHAGRDLALPDIERIFGCFATALPIRFIHNQPEVAIHSLLQPVAQAFRSAYQHALAPTEIARIIGADNTISAITATGAQFFFTFLDFEALGSLQSQTLTLDWDNSYAEIQPPLARPSCCLAHAQRMAICGSHCKQPLQNLITPPCKALWMVC